MSLCSIQQRLKAPKGQMNSFGGYKYRSCEDILEAVKPILKDYSYAIGISDDMVLVGDRIYVKATAYIMDKENKIIATATAFAREAETKKGMDDSQITGTASSYARKYALNGLFAIDDTKDADTNEAHDQATGARINKEQKQDYLTVIREQIATLNNDGLKETLDELTLDAPMKRAVWADLSEEQQKVIKSLTNGS